MIRRLFASASLVFFFLFFAAASRATAASKPNLVLITLDSVRADRMSFLGGKGATTPNLDHLAKESIVFEHAYAQSPGTVVSHATILTGSYPQGTGLTEIGGTLTTSLPSLPELLKGQGYKTAAFVGSIDLDPWNGLAQGFDRGFQSYDAGFRPVIPGDAKPAIIERSGAEVVAHAIAWLNKNAQGGPFFIWVHINDASAAHASYNAALAASDAAVGKLIAALKAQKADTNTAIVVVADHGQSLGAHGEDTHGIFLYDETIHVPLLIRLPGSAADREASKRQSAARRRRPNLLEIARHSRALANAGAIIIAGCEIRRRIGPARLFAQRSWSARLWMERARILARGKVPLHSRSQT